MDGTNQKYLYQLESITSFLSNSGYFNLQSKVKNGVQVKKKPSELYHEYRSSEPEVSCPRDRFEVILWRKRFYKAGFGRNAAYEVWVDETAQV